MESFKDDSLTKEERDFFERTTIYDVMTQICKNFKDDERERTEIKFANMLETSAEKHGLKAEFERGLELTDKPKKTLSEVIELELITFKLLVTDAIYGLKELKVRTPEELEATEKEMRDIIAETEKLLEDIKKKDDGRAI